MSAAVAHRWDVPTVDWLATRDPALAHLPAALATTSADWTLHDVQWSPGERCRLDFQVSAAALPPRFVALDVCEAGWSQRDYRADPDLPGLVGACDSEAVLARLVPVVGATATNLRVDPVRYRSGSRCVLRYEVEVAGRAMAMFAKVLHSDDFADLATAAARVDAVAGPEGVVPQLLAVWPDVGVVVSRAVDGVSLSTVLNDRRLTVTDRVAAAGQMGVVLAAFAAQPADVPRSWTCDDQIVSLTALAQPVRAVEPALADRFQAAVDVLASSRPASSALVLGHGGFRAGQVVRGRSGELTILDLDGVCRSDPARDLAAALAHLRWQAVKSPQNRSTLELAQRQFLSGYGGAGGSCAVGALRWWRAASLLQVAARRYRRLDTADWPLVPHLLDAAEELLPPVARTSERANVDPLDVHAMTPLLNRALTGEGAGRGGLVVTDAELVSSAPGRRRVVRYVLRGSDSTPVSLVGKWYSDGHRARLLNDHLRELSRGPFRHGRLRVPAPVAYLPAHQLVLYRPAEGRVVSELDTAEASRGVRDAADWLVALHTSNVVLPRAWDLDKEATSTADWASTVGGYHHGSAERASELASGWARAARAVEVSSTVPIHKDFHAGHVFVGAQTYAIDLDEARYGDPALDLAHFCVYLTWQGQRQWGQHVEALRGEFLEHYAAATGWADSGSFAPYSAYTWLKIAKQIALRSGPARATDANRDDAVSEALTRGLSCLDR